MKKKYLKKLVEKLVEKSFSNGKIVESEVVKVIKTLKALGVSDSVFTLSEYVKQLKRIERKHTMYIQTATALSSDQINKMKKVVEKKIKITKVLVDINPEILGGFKLKIGDEVWDETVLGKVNSLKEAIINGRSN